MNNRLIKSNDAGGGGGCTNTVDLYNPFPDGGGVALYQLNGNADDVSGNYDGTASNVTYGAGQFGQAGVFNGSSSYVYNANAPLTASTSISIWLKTSSFPSTQQVVNFGGQTSPSCFGDFGIGKSTGGVYAFTKDSSNSTNGTASYSITANEWHNIVAVRDNSNLVFYIDGVLKETVSVASSQSNNGLTLGRRYCSGTPQYFDGELDQVRIFSRALRPYEVEALYTEEYCTPTIVPSEHFNTVTYIGDGTTNNPITSVGFEPDFVWIKNRDYSGGISHQIFDSVRGDTAGSGGSLSSNTTNAEYFDGTKGVKSFDIDGFTLDGGVNGEYGVNGAPGGTYGSSYVAWNFKAGGAAVTNTDGTITSQVSANTEAGFSIVSYTGNGANATVGHGLGNAPKAMIIKDRDNVRDWAVYHIGNTGASGNAGQERLKLNTTDATTTYAPYWNGTNPTSIVFSIGNEQNTNSSGQKFIAYCFAEVEGFSNFGSYVGTGTTSGAKVITGFEPAFIMTKRTDLGSQWVILDNKRILENPRDYALYPNLSNAEEGPAFGINFLENGFQVVNSGSTNNASGGKYIYMAFAADPTAVEPSLEDSFNTVTYTGTGSTNPITTVGFQPDLVWLKRRDSGIGTTRHLIFDSIRGVGKRISSESSDQEYTVTQEVISFDNNGFTLGSNGSANGSGGSLVSWNWKGAEIPAINSNGSIPSVVSANPAAGFSIVSYTAGGTANVGHGLGSAPAVIITKNLDVAEQWFVYHKDVGTQKFLGLNTTSAPISNSGVYTSITDTTFTNLISSTSRNYINYCFAEVAGFSKFGSYTGQSGDTSGYINCGFEPAFLMYKRYDNGGDWYMIDNKRGGNALRAHSSAAEFALNQVTFDSTGFTINGSTATNGESSIYMAFANQF